MNQSTFEPITRAVVPMLDAVLGQPFQVLDDGFVRCVDYMGDDAAIVQAARVSYGKGTTTYRDDLTLIRYLLRHHHTTPFEQATIKLHVRVPMDTWRQWIRHRTMSVNEYSTRYSEAIDAQQVTPFDHWRKQSEGNRQGSGELFEHRYGEIFSGQESDVHRVVTDVYQEWLQQGMAREQARKILPLGTYTEAYITINLLNLLRFLNLRTDSAAQEEIRSYADVILNEIVQIWVPSVYSAFLDYWRDAVTFSAMELAVLRGEVEEAALTKRERKELAEKRKQVINPRP